MDPMKFNLQYDPTHKTFLQILYSHVLKPTTVGKRRRMYKIILHRMEFTQICVRCLKNPGEQELVILTLNSK